MKFISRIVPIISIVIVTILSIIFIDFNESSKYLQFPRYNKSFMRINYKDDNSINNNTIQKILNSAKNYNIIILKSNVIQNEDKAKNIYISVDNINELETFLSSAFKIKMLKSKNFDETKSYISTYTHEDSNQVGQIYDFLNNDYYNYYTFGTLMLTNGNLYGEYIILYKDFQDYDSFINDVKIIVGSDINSNSSFTNPQKYVAILISVSILILMLFYFIFQIYDSYNVSKKIGCMSLLGFDKIKIAKKIIGKRILIYLVTSILAIFCSFFCVENISLKNIALIMLINFILILLTYLINYMCVKIILRHYNLYSIIKKQNLALKINKISFKLKALVTVLLVVVLNILFQNLISLSSNLEIYKHSKELLDYGIIDNFKADASELFDYNKHSELFRYIVNDNRLKIFYSEFSKYRENTEDELKLINQWESEGSDYRYASVDRNYLKKESLIIYDLDNNPINIDDIKGIFFLFPKSKIDEIEKFNIFYTEYSSSDYIKYNIEHIFHAYLYDDQKLNSYRLNLKIKYVDSPIIRVIDESIKISYLESPIGISVFGNSLSTGLKIEIGDDINETINILKEHIKSAGLENLICEDNFLSFFDYFNDEIQTERLVSTILILILTIVLCLYVIISSQVVSLYVKSENKKVMVKALLGFNKYDIFNPIIQKSIKYNIITLILSLIILCIIGIFNLLLFIISVSTLLIIDFVIISLLIKFYNFSKIYIQLKGENYD